MRSTQVGAVVRDLEIAYRRSIKSFKCSDDKVVGPMTCEFQPGKFNCVIGPSGCGKTTLMSIICGHRSHHQRIKNGSVTVYDETSATGYTDFTSYRRLTGNQIRYVPSVDVFPTSMRVEDILRCSVQLHSGVETAESHRVVAAIATWLDLNEVLGMRLDTLTSEAEASRGERKRISIAKELCSAKDGQLSCLCLDEPTLNLDTALSIEMIKLLKTLIHQGSIGTVIATLHQPTPMIFGMIDHMILMDSNGHVLCQGPPRLCMDLLHPRSLKGNWDLFLEYAAHEESARILEEKYQGSPLCRSTVHESISQLPIKKSQLCQSNCKNLAEDATDFGRETRILSQFLMRYVMGNTYISILTPLLSVCAGVFLGLLFRGSFHEHSSTPAPYFLPENLANSNSMRTLTWLATASDTPLDTVRKDGISGQVREDPFEKLAGWPTTYRFLYRTVHTYGTLASLHPFYPEYSYNLWARNESFVNNYLDLEYFLPAANTTRHIDESVERLMEASERTVSVRDTLDEHGDMVKRMMAEMTAEQHQPSVGEVQYDSDLAWDDLNFFTPRFMYTEIDALLQLGHYSWYHVSWESFRKCMTKQLLSQSLMFYLCIVQNGMPVLDNYISASGLPSLSSLTRLDDSKLNSEEKMFSEKSLTGSGDDQSQLQRRRLFLELDPSFAVFDVLRAVSQNWLPGFYEITMDILDNITNSMSIVAALFFVAAALGFVGMEYFQYFFLLRNCANRDATNGHYGRSSFYIALNVAHFPLEFLSALAFTFPVCLISGLESKGWVVTILLCWLFVAVMSSIHRLLCSVCDNVGSAVRVSPLIVMLLVLFSGFFIRSADVPSWLQTWAIYFSPYRWAIYAMGINYYPNHEYSGPIPNELVYAANGIDRPSMRYCVGVLFIQLIIYRILGSIAFVSLHKESGLY